MTHNRTCSIVCPSQSKFLVIGGLKAFGVIGLFIGPVMLAVACTLLLDGIKGPEDSLENTADIQLPACGQDTLIQENQA